MPTNIERAQSAIQALEAGTDYDGRGERCVKTYCGDLLANLMHLCHRRSIDFEECLNTGRTHFLAELRGDDFTEPCDNGG